MTMLSSTLTRLSLVRKLTPYLTGQVCNVHITLVTRANDVINQESKVTTSTSKSDLSTNNQLTDVDQTKDEVWRKNEPGLLEFFDSPENWGDNEVRVGRPWRVDELRNKSNSDLHKLWYVLYKERNMLLTMQEACESEGRIFPSPERIEKVEESMKNLENIVRERNKAYFKLEVGEDATAERSMAFRQDQFGRWRWQPIYEHYKPLKYSKNWKVVFGPNYSKDVTNFLNAWRERQRNKEYAKLKLSHYTVRNLLRRFPNIDIEYLKRKYPKVPVEYYRDNLNFETEYRPLVSKGAYDELH